MSLRRALVVDDSRVARVALKKQLETYDLSVELADSAEEALDFLAHDAVDAIFMDHNMPGMDGLDALKALKSNPKTATIPVMMYTSKEGEVYVSQARALGAVDVLPKQAETNVLFGMLVKLGLVKDRRRPPQVFDEPAEAGGDTESGESGEPPGLNLTSVLTRILEDQRSALQSDIYSGQQSFAKRVADEVYRRQKAEEAKAADEQADADEHAEAGAQPMPIDVPEDRGRPGVALLIGAMAVALVSLLTMLLTARTERDLARGEIAQLEAIGMMAGEPASAPVSARPDPAVTDTWTPALLDTLSWAMNETGRVPFGRVPFDGRRADQIGEFIAQLESGGFEGTVLIASHLGEFCLSIDSNGLYGLADPDTPISACALIGHPLDNSTMLDDRQTPGFRQFIETSPLVNGGDIALDVIANDRLSSTPAFSYPVDPENAGEWNEVAALNNRVEYTLLIGPK